MKLYCVNPPTEEYAPEAEDTTEWFTSRKAAMKAFNGWVKQLKQDISDETNAFHTHYVALREIVVAELPLRALLIAVLNRRGWRKSTTTLREWQP